MAGALAGPRRARLLRGPFADRRFLILLTGQSLSAFGDMALYLTLAIWAKSLTGSNSAAGCVFLALGIPALFAPVAGQLADRVRRKPLLITANAATAVMVLALLAVHSASQLWIIYLVAFGYGISFGVLGSAGAGLRKDLLGARDLAAANAAIQSVGQGMRVVAPLAGAGLFVALGGPAVAVLDAATFAGAITALLAITVTESDPASVPREPVIREAAAGLRHIRSVPLLRQITLLTACAFAVIGLNETVVFAVIGTGLHKPPSFFGVYGSFQGAGAIAGGIALAWMIRRLGLARTVGLALAESALAAAAYLTDSILACLAGAVADGVGLVWLVAASGTAMQRYSPPRLQGRVSAAWTMLVLTPQTLSIAAGALLITVVNYRVLLLGIIVAVGGCGLVLLIRPAPDPADAVTLADAEPDTETDAETAAGPDAETAADPQASAGDRDRALAAQAAQASSSPA